MNKYTGIKFHTAPQTAAQIAGILAMGAAILSAFVFFS